VQDRDDGADGNVSPASTGQNLPHVPRFVPANRYVPRWRSVHGDGRVAVPNTLSLATFGVDGEDLSGTYHKLIVSAPLAHCDFFGTVGHNVSGGIGRQWLSD
jgi:hypothetical protein